MSVNFASYRTLLTRRKLLLRISCFDLADTVEALRGRVLWM
jgi:hypothetical protein